MHGRESGMEDREDLLSTVSIPNILLATRSIHHSSFLVPLQNLEMRFLLRGKGCNTPCYGNPNQVFNLQLSLKVRANQFTKVWIRIQRWRLKNFKFLYSVDRMTQLANFENLFKSNQTLLPKDNLFPMDYSTSVKIYKNLLRSRSTCFNVPNRAIQLNFQTEILPV
jgi:hypothetical protein